jgi:hypothetical protein
MLPDECFRCTHLYHDDVNRLCGLAPAMCAARTHKRQHGQQRTLIWSRNRACCSFCPDFAL